MVYFHEKKNLREKALEEIEKLGGYLKMVNKLPQWSWMTRLVCFKAENVGCSITVLFLKTQGTFSR